MGKEKGRKRRVWWNIKLKIDRKRRVMGNYKRKKRSVGKKKRTR